MFFAKTSPSVSKILFAVRFCVLLPAEEMLKLEISLVEAVLSVEFAVLKSKPSNKFPLFLFLAVTLSFEIEAIK